VKNFDEKEKESMNETEMTRYPRKDEWSARLTIAAAILDITVEELTAKLADKKGLGITEKDAEGVSILDSKDFMIGDFFDAFEAIGGRTTLRRAYGALKGGKKDATEVTGPGADPLIDELRALGFKPRLDDADVATLLRIYKPDKPSHPVSVALKKRFGDKPVVAFREDGSVAVTESVQYIADIEQGYAPVEAITVDGHLARLWMIGAKPNEMVDEDPLFPGQPLRAGCSRVNNRNWTRVKFEDRQLCRIILERGDIDPNNKEAVLRLLERAEGSKLAEAYPEAELDYREQKGKDILPKLKVQLGDSKPNNPFPGHRKY
jgi:hypothetical protein